MGIGKLSIAQAYYESPVRTGLVAPHQTARSWGDDDHIEPAGCLGRSTLLGYTTTALKATHDTV